MTLTYQIKSGGNGQVHVPFNPPLAGYDDVKPRMLSMKAEAQEGLGMVRCALHSPPVVVSMNISFWNSPHMRV